MLSWKQFVHISCLTCSGIKCNYKDRHNLVLFLPLHHPVLQRRLPCPWIREMLLLVGRQRSFRGRRRGAGGRGRGAAAVCFGPAGRSGTPRSAAPPKPRASRRAAAVGRARQSLLGGSRRRGIVAGFLRGWDFLPVQQRGSVRPLHHPARRRRSVRRS